MAHYIVPKETAARLEKLQSTYRFRRRTQTIDPKTGEYIPGKVVCEILDMVRGNQVYARAIADSDDEALHAALDKAEGSERPKTPAELVTENAELRAELAALKDAPATEPGDRYDQMTGKELVGELETRSLSLPEGSMQSNKFQTAARDLLRRDDIDSIESD